MLAWLVVFSSAISASVSQKRVREFLLLDELSHGYSVAFLFVGYNLVIHSGILAAHKHHKTHHRKVHFQEKSETKEIAKEEEEEEEEEVINEDNEKAVAMAPLLKDSEKGNQRDLNEEEKEDENPNNRNEADEEEEQQPPQKPKIANESKVSLRVIEGDFSWGGSEASPTLTGIDLEIKSGEFVVVVGQVGSGKSSLLSAILGEMQKV